MKLQFTKKKAVTKSKDQIKLLTDKQYAKAMDHVLKHKFYEAQRKKNQYKKQYDQQCTFKPNIHKYPKYQDRQKMIHQRLIKWDGQKNQRMRSNIIKKQIIQDKSCINLSYKYKITQGNQNITEKYPGDSYKKMLSNKIQKNSIRRSQTRLFTQQSFS